MMNSAAAASASAQQTDLAGSLAPGGPIGDAPSAPGGPLLLHNIHEPRTVIGIAIRQTNLD